MIWPCFLSVCHSLYGSGLLKVIDLGCIIYVFVVSGERSCPSRHDRTPLASQFVFGVQSSLDYNNTARQRRRSAGFQEGEFLADSFLLRLGVGRGLFSGIRALVISQIRRRFSHVDICVYLISCPSRLCGLFLVNS